MKDRKRLSAIALLLVLVMCLGACGQAAEEPTKEKSAVEYKDTITIDMNSEISNFDPAYLSGVGTSRVACFVMDHLCYMDHDGNIIPRVAELGSQRGRHRLDLPSAQGCQVA